MCQCGKHTFIVLVLCSKLMLREQKQELNIPAMEKRFILYGVSVFMSLFSSPVCEGLLSSCTCCLLQYSGYCSFLFFQSAREKKRKIWHKQWYWITLYHLAICFVNFLKITAWKFKNRFQNCYDIAYDSWALHLD